MPHPATDAYTHVYGQTQQGTHLIGGAPWGQTEAGSFQVLNPACHKDRVGVHPLAGAAEVQAAIQAASQAQPGWFATAAAEREQLIKRLKHLLTDQQSELVSLLSRETGQTVQLSQADLQTLRDGLQQPPALAGPPAAMLVLSSATSCANLDYMVWLFSALAAGQTVLWHPAATHASLAYALVQLLQAAGLPPGVLNLVQGGQPVRAALNQALAQGQLQSPPSLPAKTLRPFVVSADQPLEAVVKAAIAACFGQTGPGRVHSGQVWLPPHLSARFCQQLLSAMKGLRLGDPSLSHELLCGPLCCEQSLAQFAAQAEQAQQQGAQLLWGPGRITRDSKPKDFVGDPELGHYAWPMIWHQVSLEMPLAQAAVTGPTMFLIERRDSECADEQFRP